MHRARLPDCSGAGCRAGNRRGAFASPYQPGTALSWQESHSQQRRIINKPDPVIRVFLSPANLAGYQNPPNGHNRSYRRNGRRHECHVTVPAALAFLQQYPDVNLVLVGLQRCDCGRIDGTARANRPACGFILPVRWWRWMNRLSGAEKQERLFDAGGRATGQDW